MPPLLAVDNILNRRMYPSHTVVADEEAVDHEVMHLYSGRRDDLTYYTSTTTNQARTITITCDRIRACDYFWLDRMHNLAGKTLTWACSNDNFTSTETLFSIALPTACMPGNPSGYYGVRTEEGAWWKTYDRRAAKYWRLTIAAMGSGLVPQIGFLMAGPALSMGAWTKPVDLDRDALVVTEDESTAGWLGRGRVARRRRGAIAYRFEDFLAYEQNARLQIDGHFGNGRPTILCRNLAQGHQAVLAVRASGEQGVSVEAGNWSYPRTVLRWEEHEPRDVAA